MSRSLSIASLVAAILIPSSAWAQQRHSTRTVRYPRVYGATGHAYGPTQAHYQYQRQYGRPWHGYGGISGSGSSGNVAYSYRLNGGHHHRHYGYSPFSSGYSNFGYSSYGYYGRSSGLSIFSGPAYGYGSSGYANYGPVYNYVPMAPTVMQAHPLWIGQNPFDNQVLRDAQRENDQRWKQPLAVQPQVKAKPLLPKESSPQAKIRSLHDQVLGDGWFRKQKYSSAYKRYKEAMLEASDRPEPYFRLGVTLAATRQFAQAVKYLKRGLQVDPDYPAKADSLLTLYGEENLLAKSSLLHKVADWVREDIRDPDRLFLIGVLLYLDNDPDKAQEFFKAALRLSGSGDHLLAFLQPAELEREQAKPAEEKGLIMKRQPDIPPPPLPAEPLPVPKPPADDGAAAGNGPQFPLPEQ